MPLWAIYHNPDAFTDVQKEALAVSITKIYTDFGLPKFYVGIVFVPTPARSFFISAEPANNFVRIAIDHIARQLPTPEIRTKWVHDTNAALKPHIQDRGLNFEWHISETPFDLWSIEGFRPPPGGSKAEARWIAENKATAHDHVVIPAIGNKV